MNATITNKVGTIEELRNLWNAIDSTEEKDAKSRAELVGLQSEILDMLGDVVGDLRHEMIVDGWELPFVNLAGLIEKQLMVRNQNSRLRGLAALDDLLALIEQARDKSAAKDKVIAKPRKPRKTDQKQRGRPSTAMPDAKLLAEYNEGLEAGDWGSVTAFAKAKGKKRSTIFEALKRARNAPK